VDPTWSFFVLLWLLVAAGAISVYLIGHAG
jgi:hypothetical protein